MHNRPIDDFIYRRFLQYSKLRSLEKTDDRSCHATAVFGIVILTDFYLDQT
jgi:hypothetical protein